MTTMTLTVAALLELGGATGLSNVDSVTKELRVFCHELEYTDNVMPRGVAGLRFLTEYGPSGHSAVVRTARERSRDGACALDILLTARDTSAVPIAREVLRDRGAPGFMRAKALAVTGDFRDADSFDQALTAFRSGVRELVGPAAYAIGKIGDPRGWAELRSALKAPRYAAFAYAIINGMAQPGHEDAVPLIAQAVAEKKDNAASGCEALWRIGSPSARHAAIVMLDDVHPVVRLGLARTFRSSLTVKVAPPPPTPNGASVVKEPGPGESVTAADVAALDKLIEQAKQQQ